MLLAAAARPDSVEGRALADVITLSNDFAFQLALAEAIQARDQIIAWLARTGGVAGAMAELSRSLAIGTDDTVESVERELYEAALLSPSEWSDLIAALAQGAKTDREQATRLQTLRATTGADRFAALLSVFCIADGSARASIVTKSVRDRHPALCRRFQDRADTGLRPLGSVAAL